MGSDNRPASLAPSPESASVDLKRFLRANCCNRFCIFIVLVILVACSSYFNYTLVQLTQELKTDEAQFEALRDTVAKQSKIMNRFNQSVTNSDVLQKVTALEQQLATTEKEMNEKMIHSQEAISTLLNSTLTDLAETVAQAKAEIHTDVERVEKGVEKYALETNEKFNMENSFMIWQLAGTFTVLACLISMWHMTAHLRHFRNPSIQRKILAILWMSPIYGITSWFSLVFPGVESILAIVKDFYEAYIIYQFLAFLICVLGKGNRSVVVNLLANHADHLEPPIRFCGCCTPDPYDTPKKKADAVLLQCQAFAMQFVFFRPMTTIGIVLCKKYYEASPDDPAYLSPKFWMVVIQNISIFTAFSGLLKFYHAVQDDLAWCRPFPKFLCIKGIVFMTFWQGLAISILAETSGKERNSETWAKQAQNFLICLEMLLFSIAHFYCFPTDEWQDGYRPKENKDKKFGDNLALRDFVADLKLIVRGTKKGKKKSKVSSLDDSPPSTPETVKEAVAESSLIKGDSFDSDSSENVRYGKRRESIRRLKVALDSLHFDSDSDSDDDAEKGVKKEVSHSESTHKQTSDNNNDKIQSAYGSVDTSFDNEKQKKKLIIHTTDEAGDSWEGKSDPEHEYTATETTSLLLSVAPPLDNVIPKKSDEKPKIHKDKDDEKTSLLYRVEDSADIKNVVIPETNIHDKQDDEGKVSLLCTDEDSNKAKNVAEMKEGKATETKREKTPSLFGQKVSNDENNEKDNEKASLLHRVEDSADAGSFICFERTKNVVEMEEGKAKETKQEKTPSLGQKVSNDENNVKDNEKASLLHRVEDSADVNTFVIVETNMHEKQDDVEKVNLPCTDEDSNIAKNVSDFKGGNVKETKREETVSLLGQKVSNDENNEKEDTEILRPSIFTIQHDT